ncbi:glycosyl hydrolase 53 family protein [Arcicella aquatica]|uniref:Arabinogalactan endo-beta-1,4-galactanase n=1 Tax=Arcicella aquatica TaxID=217141 RepID=A0ABU5QRG5_9BACT|nr:glycosyl hydrolase 53 family protein [Arcicella aquatica]MEA5259681.1 glycosyl hydrolase 53 family protein [Arcicella aquatica]
MNKLINFLCCSLLLLSCSNTSNNEVIEPVKETPISGFAKGADVSWVTEMEAAGVKFYNTSGQAMECMALMKSLGMNSIRLRVWVNPSPAYNNTADVVAKAIRAKNLGLRIMIDFHYSDNWADPGKQTKPAAWTSLDLEGLKSAIGKHTTDVLTELKKNGITPEWVQVGNETNDGMLWPTGRASTNMSGFAQMINAGYDGVKAIFPDAKVIVHISNGYDNQLFRWMFDGLKANGAKYDVIGMSLYPTYAPDFASGGWAKVNQQCLTNMNDMISRYNKEVMIVEVGMPWDSASECKLFLSDIITKTKSISNSKGLGVLYWEPQAHNNWVGYTLGAFDNSGKPTIAMDAFLP